METENLCEERRTQSREKQTDRRPQGRRTGLDRENGQYRGLDRENGQYRGLDRGLDRENGQYRGLDREYWLLDSEFCEYW